MEGAIVATHLTMQEFSTSVVVSGLLLAATAYLRNKLRLERLEERGETQ